MTERGEVETRAAVVTDVRYPERIIEIVAVPYNEWTTVEYKGRLIEESFQPGAFGADIQKRANRFLVNLEHDLSRVVGRVQSLHPGRSEGLVTELRVRRGPEGDQVLDDADDGMIMASVGFAAGPEHQHWETRSRRRIVKAFLDHIALTFTPAYHGAGVLAVRTAPFEPRAAAVPTPNFDRIALQELVGRYSPE